MTEPAISAHELAFSYGDNLAVDGISFDIGVGEIVGFLGPNGAGKSTTVKLLTGQLKPSSGSAVLLGIDVANKPKAVQSQIGVAFEHANLYEQMSAIENLDLFAKLYRVKNFDARILLEKVGLSDRGKDRVSSYSKGMKQRLMLARALVSDPKILFLDEPTDGLDPVSSQAIQTLIAESASKGATVFLTTHDMVEADKLSDRVAFIDRGKIVAMDKPSELKQQYGQRKLKVELQDEAGQTEIQHVRLDEEQTGTEVSELLSTNRVLTMHSEEATLEDIFIEITGRELRQ